jgi:tRNA G18 (ribose-2'-O)-methylase SpoU
MLGTVESLNVAVCAGICLAETRRQRGLGTA